jgi:NAD(P)H-hydrate epimerase
MSRDSQGAGGAEGHVLVFSRRAVREVDRLAVEQYGIPSIVLMENAGLHLAEVALDLSESDPPRILVACGPGNNGGDGLCAARHLHNEGAQVEIVLIAPESAVKGDAAVHLRTVKAMGLPVHAEPHALRKAAARLGPDVIIDALLGTGLERAVEGAMAEAIGALNALGDGGATILSADLPSGLDCDRGVPLGAAVRATATVTFVGLKAGFLQLSAQEYIGDVMIADIGAPRELVERLGQRVADHEEHDGPDERPGHDRPRGTPPRRPG